MVQFALPAVLLSVAVTQFSMAEPPKVALDMDVELVTMLNISHYRTPAEGAELQRLQAALDQAEKAVDANPEDASAQRAYGHALENLWRYHDAITAYSNAIAQEVRDPAAYIDRGRAFLILRWYEPARTDLDRAIELAPSNYEARYQRALAYYFQQDFDNTLGALREAIRLASTEDQRATAAFWSYITLKRLGHSEEADAILTRARADANVGEAKPYNTALLFFKGERTAAQLQQQMKSGERAAAILGYALAMNELFQGNDEAAMEQWQALVRSNKCWPCPAHIGAESEIVAVKGVQKTLPF